MDSGIDMKKAQDVLERLIFDMLLVTDGRTTDLLEAILDEKMLVSVIRQQRLADDSYLRESVLISDKSRFIVSHNIAIVYSQYVPPALFEKIASREEGIGSSIRSIGIESYRRVIDFGMRNGEEAADMFQKPLTLNFPDLKRPVPYKNYVMQFGHVPGIQILEYFNPELVNHRLHGFTNNKMEE